MKILTAFLAMATLGLIVVCSIQRQQLSSQKQQIAALRMEAEQQATAMGELNERQGRLEQQRREMAEAQNELTRQAAAAAGAQTSAPVAMAQPETLTNGEAAKLDKAGLGGVLSKMMQDPDTKKFIREQQRMMMDQLYSPLVKKMGLNAEDAARLKDMMADGMMKSAEKATSMFGGSVSNRSELAASMVAEQASLDEQIKAFLGEDRYAMYKDYQQTVGERTQLNMFRQQYTGEYPLSDMQSEQLLVLMKEEKGNLSASSGFGGAGQNQGNLDAMLSEEQSEKMLKSQEAANQRVFERARMVLSPDQLQSFGGFQSNQLQMMRMGISMARRFMGPEGK